MTLAFIYIPLLVIFDLRLQLEPVPGVAAAGPDDSTGSARRSTTPAPATPSSHRCRSGSSPRCSPSSSARWRRWRSPATASSGARRSRSCVILPIALPGIVTGVALNTTFTQILGIDLGLFTIVVGHATFCIVVVYNNVVARLRRVSGSFEEASADLGATPWTTFRRVTLPNMQTALVAGGLLAFGLCFDEIIVTTFTAGAGEQTLPIWIFSNFSRPNQLPIVNVVAVIVILISIVPVYLAHKLTREEGGAAPGRGGGAVAAEGGAVP